VNDVHYWLADKNLITQNIDGLDGKAGNQGYIAIHRRIDQMTLFHDQQGPTADIITTPWDNIDEDYTVESLLNLFQIKGAPELNKSFKPYVLLFDEIYTELYRITEACQRMRDADRIIFIGTSFSVNITYMALEIAREQNTPIEIIDPKPVNIPYPNATIHTMTASTYVNKVEKGDLA
jgi:NAD-dependent deacetylase